MMIRLGDDLLQALQMSDETDTAERVWRVCSYHLERVELDASAWAAVPPPSRRHVPAGHVAVELSLAIGCDFLPTTTWDVVLETAEGELVPLVPMPCFGPINVFQTFTCPQDALAGLMIRSLTYKK